MNARDDATLEWFGCTTYRLRVGDQVIMLDAYVERIEGSVGAGTTTASITEANWLLIGHSHFDHLWGAHTIASQTGATVIGSHETVRVLNEFGVPAEQLIPVSGGERLRLSDEITVQVFPALHSCVWSTFPAGGGDEVSGDLGVTYQDRQARLAEFHKTRESLPAHVQEHFDQTKMGARGDGGVLSFLIDSPEGSLLFQDTSGYWTGILERLSPDIALLAAAGRGNVDGEPAQGSLAQFIGRQVDLLRPAAVALGHHDDWMAGFSMPVFDVSPIAQHIAATNPSTTFLTLPHYEPYPIFTHVVQAVSASRMPKG